MKVLTWNINGLRSFKQPLQEVFQELNSDIICFQETKITRSELTSKYAIVDGYNSYFSFSAKRSGYSGVATYVRDSSAPHKQEEGISGILATGNTDQNIYHYGNTTLFTEDELRDLDSEGRVLMTQHKVKGCCTPANSQTTVVIDECNTRADSDKIDQDSASHCTLVVINLYCPRVACDRDDRKDFKKRFCELLDIRVRELLKHQVHVVCVGDFNIAHKQLDMVLRDDPREQREPDENNAWFDSFILELPSITANRMHENGNAFSNEKLNSTKAVVQLPSNIARSSSNTAISSSNNTTPSGCMIDTFRHLHPTQPGAYTCWCTRTGARATNYGDRIDYILADALLTVHSLKNCAIRPEVMGSDHCPVVADFSCIAVPPPNGKLPSACTRNWVQFLGKQKKVVDFFSAASKVSGSDNNSSATVGKIVSSKSDSSSVTQDAAPNGIKRSNTDTSSTAATKRKKHTNQTTLLGFFGKTQDKTPVIPKTQPSVQASKLANTLPANTVQQNSAVSSTWKSLLRGPGTAPLCKGHNEKCVLRTVKKEGPNIGKQFYVCARPQGAKTNTQARCEHFEWVNKPSA